MNKKKLNKSLNTYFKKGEEKKNFFFKSEFFFFFLRNRENKNVQKFNKRNE
jgi:hypothetical protein